MQAAAANSATAGMEAATAKKMLAEFQVAITTQVASLEQRLGVDAAELAKVTSLTVHLSSKYVVKKYGSRPSSRVEEVG